MSARRSSKVLPTVQTHETALPHGHQPVDSKGGTGQDAEGVSRTQMALLFFRTLQQTTKPSILRSEAILFGPQMTTPV